MVPAYLFLRLGLMFVPNGHAQQLRHRRPQVSQLSDEEVMPCDMSLGLAGHHQGELRPTEFAQQQGHDWSVEDDGFVGCLGGSQPIPWKSLWPDHLCCHSLLFFGHLLYVFW